MQHGDFLKAQQATNGLHQDCSKVMASTHLFSIKSISAAAFANIDWQIVKGFHILPGIRFNYDKKEAIYDRKTYGGLQTDDAELIALKNLVYADQSYNSEADENNHTYNITVAYKPSRKVNAFASYSTSYKPVGVNVTGLPTVNGATCNRPGSDQA